MAVEMRSENFGGKVISVVRKDTESNMPHWELFDRVEMKTKTILQFHTKNAVAKL